MVTTGFGLCLVFSALIAIYMAQKGYDNIDGHYWTIVMLVPAIVMGYWLKVQVASAEASLVLFCFINLGTTILLGVILFAMLRDLGFRASPWLKVVVYGVAFAQMFIIWLLVRDGTAASMVRVIDMGVGYSTEMSGVLKWFLQYDFVLTVAILVVGFASLAMARGRTYSRRTLAVYTTMVGAGAVIYVVEALVDAPFSLLPYLLVIGSAVVALGYDRAHSHDIASLVSEQQEHHSSRGYVALGLDGRFLGCNEKAYGFLPDLLGQRVDAPLPKESEAGRLLGELVDRFKQKGRATARFEVGEMACACDISTFAMRHDGAAQGYLVDIRDATQEKRAFDILEDYNQTLNQEVAEQTAHITQMQRKIVLGMANMVENRDGNTGGHVKRTSDVIQILVREIMAEGYIDIDDELAHDIVRAAPMHDLGKISIDSSILNKPGKLTAEEYEIMKTHSTTSGEMVMILLDGVEEDHFVKTAFNVARYHHERWDGRGYPEGLVGEMIPLEARIMAVADVYDALVSKRVYKEPMSFEQARAIMCEGMGTQFDPNMRMVFFGCREELERYYSTAE